MSVLGMIFKPVTTMAKMGFKGMTHGPGTRAATMMFGGSAVGAAGGFMSGYDMNSRLEGAFKGAGVGALAGAFGGAALHPGAWKVGAAGAMGAGRYATKLGMHKAAWKGLSGMAKRPGLTMGVAAAGVGGVMAANASWGSNQDFESPTLDGAEVMTNYNQMAIASAEMGQIGSGTFGTMPQMQGRFQHATWMQQMGSMMEKTPGGRMANSAVGLVQGLHQGRHG